MDTTPSDELPNGPRNKPDDSDRPQSPSEVLAVILDWLRHYWEIPRQKARWTEILTVLFAFVAAAATIYSAWVFQGQLTVARTALEAQTRPWIGIEEVPQIKSFQVRGGFVNISFELLVHNYGQSPATLSGEPYFVLGDLVKAEPRMWKKNEEGKSTVCDEEARLFSSPVGLPRFPHPVFQATSSTTQNTTRINVHQPIVAYDGPFDGQRLYNYLSGCIVYYGPTSGPYRTKVIYRVEFSSDGNIAENGTKYRIANIKQEWFGVE